MFLSWLKNFCTRRQERMCVHVAFPKVIMIRRGKWDSTSQYTFQCVPMCLRTSVYDRWHRRNTTSKSCRDPFGQYIVGMRCSNLFCTPPVLYSTCSVLHLFCTPPSTFSDVHKHTNVSNFVCTSTIWCKGVDTYGALGA